VLLDYRHEAAEGKMIIRNSEIRGFKDIEILDFRSVAYSSYTETTERIP
jgi:hypothetical protein